MRHQKYFIAYTTQTSINDILYHNDMVATKDPFGWVAQKNAEDSKIQYSLINCERVEGVLPRPKKATITYVSQKEIGDSLFKTEEIYRKNPITWISEKNAGSKVKYSLINWWANC